MDYRARRESEGVSNRMRIQVNPRNCTGCRLCLQVCTIEHFDEINPKKAALRVEAKFPDPGEYHPRVCIQCGKCAKICPEEAVHRNPAGAFVVDAERCTNCGTCVPECPEAVVFQHADLDHVILCDFCFECTEVCNTSAIVKWDPPEAKGA